MNCRRIEKLIPLYVEGDLEIDKSGAVLAHARSCAKCSGLISEYKESQRWLRSFAPPDFDDALLDDLKLGVLEKIEDQKARVSFLNRLSGHWAQRLIVVTSAALLIIFGALAFYVYQRGSNDPANREVIQAKGDHEGQSPEIASLPKDAETAPRASSSRKRRRHTPSLRRGEVAAVRQKNSERITVSPDRPGVETTATIETRNGFSGDPVNTEEMLRIEIQTSDPSIRIIWFSPKRSDFTHSRPITETE
jgi:hypothetical protein